MRRRLAVPIVGLLLLASTLVGVAAGQAKSAARAIRLTQHLYQTASSGAPPLSGSNSYVGTSDGRIGAARVSGAVRGANTYTGAGHFKGRNTIFDPSGSINIAFAGTVLGPDQISGSGTFTGGTGRYKGARGKFTFTATQQSPTTFLRNLQGRISFH